MCQDFKSRQVKNSPLLRFSGVCEHKNASCVQEPHMHPGRVLSCRLRCFYLIVALSTHEPNAHEPRVSRRCVHLKIVQLYKDVSILYTLRSVQRKNAFCVNDPLNNIISKSILGDFVFDTWLVNWSLHSGPFVVEWSRPSSGYQLFRWGRDDSLSTFPKAAALSTPLSHSLHFLMTVSSTSPSSSSYSTSSYLYWSLRREIFTMVLMSLEPSNLATGPELLLLELPWALLDGKTRRCLKSAEAQHFCCLAIICFSRLRFWMTRMASGVRLREKWISCSPSFAREVLEAYLWLDSPELDRGTLSHEVAKGLGTLNHECLLSVSGSGGTLVGLLRASCFRLADGHDVVVYLSPIPCRLLSFDWTWLEEARHCPCSSFSWTAPF